MAGFAEFKVNRLRIALLLWVSPGSQSAAATCLGVGESEALWVMSLAGPRMKDDGQGSLHLLVKALSRSQERGSPTAVRERTCVSH
jgi:hypothetical protein